MKKLFVSYCTEYEAGWGQRPDGLMIGEDLKSMTEEIGKRNVGGNPDYFWRYSEPEEVFCDDDTYNKIVFELNDDKFYFSSVNRLEKIGKFYKEA